MNVHKSHENWVRGQFQKKFLRKGFRNSLIHFGIIESLLLKFSRSNNFSSAISKLLCESKISKEEFCILKELQTSRNNIIHRIFAKEWNEEQINTSINSLMEKAIFVYESVRVVNKELLMKYEVKL